MDETLKKQLEITACKVRLGILESIQRKVGSSGRIALYRRSAHLSLFCKDERIS